MDASCGVFAANAGERSTVRATDYSEPEPGRVDVFNASM
jgi:hypothetical protein